MILLFAYQQLGIFLFPDMLLRKILELCEKNGYLKILPDNLNVLSVKLGPTGALLQENLRLEWFYAMVVNRESNVFLSKGSFSDAFQHAKEMCQDHAPFGVAEIVADSGEGIKNRSEDTEEARDGVDFRRCVAGDVVLKTSMFVSPALSTQFFHQWQRQRKMWFRKVSFTIFLPFAITLPQAGYAWNMVINYTSPISYYNLSNHDERKAILRLQKNYLQFFGSI